MDEDELARLCADEMWKGDRASHALGITVDLDKAGAATARMLIRDDMVNGLGVCHGGLVFALADTAFAFACNAYNVQNFAASCHIDFLRPAVLGDELRADASEDYRGRRSGYYTIRISNQNDELVALFRGRSGSNGKPLLAVISDTDSIEKSKKA
jgi:phenylacetic acid degradation protein PaaD